MVNSYHDDTYSLESLKKLYKTVTIHEEIAYLDGHVSQHVHSVYSYENCPDSKAGLDSF